MNARAKAVVQDLAGYPFTILFVLWLAHRAMQNRELAAWTRLTDKTLARHLDVLASHDYIGRTSAGWSLKSGLQLDLFNDIDILHNPENFRLSSATTALKDNSKEQEQQVAAVARGTGAVGNFPTTNPFFVENLKVCDRAGIGEPKRSQISAQFDEYGAPIRPEYIQAHVDSLRASEHVGLAIRRIESNELPRSWLDEIPRRSYDLA